VSSYLFPVAHCRHHTALAAIKRPLPPSYSPCHHQAAIATIKRPLPPPCCPSRHHAAPPATMLPLLPPCCPSRHHAAPAAIMRPSLPPSSSPCRHQVACQAAPGGPLLLFLQPRSHLPCSICRGRVCRGFCSGPESTTVGSG
jgi:hypothetical protein